MHSGRPCAVDPDVPVYGATTMQQRVTDAYRSDRFNFLLVSCVAWLAVLLAAIGVYGATAYDTTGGSPSSVCGSRSARRHGQSFGSRFRDRSR